MKVFTYRLHPTKSQEYTLNGWLSYTQQLWNAALEQRKTAYSRQGRSLSFFDQKLEIKHLKREDPIAHGIPFHVLSNPLKRLDQAYAAFFRRVKKGESPGFPRFKRRDQVNSFTLTFERIEGNGRSSRIRIPKLGLVRFNAYRLIEGKCKQFTVSCLPTGQWQLSLVCDVGAEPMKVTVTHETNVLGIDLGHGDNNLIVTSDCQRFDNERFFKRGEAVLAKRQQSFSRKQKGSNARKRAKIIVAKAHVHVRNQRLDHARKLAKLLFIENDVVAYEKLNISGLAQMCFSKSVHDVAWGQIIRCIELKALFDGKHAIAVNPKNTSQMCSNCGRVPEVKKTLGERVHRCSMCYFEIDRDANAASNVKALGLSAIGKLIEAE